MPSESDAHINSRGGQTGIHIDPPRTMFIELTSHCNMHCAFCPSDVLCREKGHLSDARLRNFLFQLHNLGLRPPVLLNVLGEPLLNKKTYEYLDLLEESGHLVTLITNISLLIDKAVWHELLRHPNLTLALSLQTVTRRSYRMRGYSKLPLSKFFPLIRGLIEEKFRTGSRARLEVHVASNYVVSHDPTVQTDRDLHLWENFPSDKAERRWISRTLGRLERLARRMRKRYPGAFEDEQARSLVIYKDHLGSRIAVDRSMLPPDFQRLKDEVFWGYMFLPNVFLVFKSLELWTRERAFLQSALPPDTFVYVEEREEPRMCMMADSFGLLANGDFILCCLDYEGEMKLGHIDSTSVEEFLRSEKRAGIRRNAMSERLCRRCKGNVFIFDTRLLERREQAVSAFGRGFWEWEPNLHGTGGRWTKGAAWTYVYARIPARRVRLSFLSEFEDETSLRLTVAVYDEAKDAFGGDHVFSFKGQKGRRSKFETAFEFTPSRLYRLEIESPTFMPDERIGNGDTRRLGLAVFAVTLII